MIYISLYIEECTKLKIFKRGWRTNGQAQHTAWTWKTHKSKNVSFCYLVFSYKVLFGLRALEHYIVLNRLEYDENRSINRNELNPQKKDPQKKSVATFLFPRQNFPKNTKMEKSIIFASFLFILSITAIILSNCNYETQFSKQKLTCKNLQTTAGTFSIRAPPSFSTNPPPPLQFFDWFCQHKYKPKKLYSHIILFSPTLQPNLKYFQNRMPHSPKNRAKRRRFSNQKIR